MDAILVMYDPLHCTLGLSCLVLQITLAHAHAHAHAHFSFLSLGYPCFDPFPWTTHMALPFAALEHIVPVVLLDTFTLIE